MDILLYEKWIYDVVNTHQVFLIPMSPKDSPLFWNSSSFL